MKEKFRLRCDLNDIHDIEDMEIVADKISQFAHIASYHRYNYLFRGYHDLTHGKIDEEAFFTLGDITSDRAVFADAKRSGLESVFVIEDAIEDDMLYIVEQSAREYYLGKVGHDRSGAFRKDITAHKSELIII